jgi:sRNA-binding carbon storage regulator CsrA
MLVTRREYGDRVEVTGPAKITIVKTHRDYVVLAIDAPGNTKIHTVRENHATDRRETARAGETENGRLDGPDTPGQPANQEDDGPGLRRLGDG